MSEITRAEILARVARQFGYYRKVTATGGSTTTIVSTSHLYETDDFHVGKFAYALADSLDGSLAPKGEERPITDYVQSTATLTVDPAFTVAVASGDIIEILRLRRSNIEDAINAAIRSAGNAWLVLKADDATVTLGANDYDYTLPTDLVGLLNVLVRTGTATPWILLDPSLWRVVKTPGAQELVLTTLAMTQAGDTLRLEYMACPSELATDSATLGIGEPAERDLVEYVIAQALFLLHNQAASIEPSGASFRSYLTQAMGWREIAESIRERPEQEMRQSAPPKEEKRERSPRRRE